MYQLYSKENSKSIQPSTETSLWVLYAKLNDLLWTSFYYFLNWCNIWFKNSYFQRYFLYYLTWCYIKCRGLLSFFEVHQQWKTYHFSRSTCSRFRMLHLQALIYDIWQLDHVNIPTEAVIDTKKIHFLYIQQNEQKKTYLIM